MTLPSKELLSEVLGVFEVIDIEEDYNELIIEYFETQDDVELNEDGVGGSTDKTINIYEFAHKCKEWASKHGVNIWSWLNNVEIRDSHKCFVKSFVGDTEQEAIFKACEYIMEKTK